MWPYNHLEIVLISSILFSLGSSYALFPREEAIGDCLAAAGVPHETQSNSTWAVDILPFNSRVPYTPSALAIPSTTQHVVSAVSCGAKLGLKVNPKCGGHSYASFGLGGADGHLVVSLERMNAVTVDPKTNIAIVGAGSRLGHLATQLFKQGGRAISHGTCPGVGVSGHTLHGGYGMISRSRGLALDWVNSATVVLANASVVVCSATQNSDLFWGLRGAGSNFGVVTSFSFYTFAAPSVATTYHINLNWQTKAQRVAGVSALRDFAENDMPPELNMRLMVGAFGSPANTSLHGTYYGSASDLNATVQSLLATIGGNFTEQTTGGWIDALTEYADGVPLDQTYPYHTHDTFYASSLTLKGLPGASLNNFVSYWSDVALQAPPSHHWWFQLNLVGGKDAAVPAVPSNATAYAHRDKAFIIQFYDKGSPADFSFMGNWAKTTTAPLAASDWGAYLNYADPQLDRATAQRLYFGTNLERLQKIKAKYDPGQLFWYPQALSPVA